MSFNQLQLIEPSKKLERRRVYQLLHQFRKDPYPLFYKKETYWDAQTGTGKTAAFTIPILQLMHEQQRQRGIRALILTPTRELAIQLLKYSDLWQVSQNASLHFWRCFST